MNLRPNPTPDINWYSGVSADRGLPTHCPFAIASLCPRHYQSLSLLKSTGATEIEPQIDESLLKKWQRSPLWPLIAEQATSVSGSDVTPASSLNQFCPEVAYLRYKVFASCIVEFNDELQRYLAYEMLEHLDVPVSDWRWTWQHLQPMHYSSVPCIQFFYRIVM